MTVKLRSWIIAGIIVLVIVIGLIVVWRFNGTGFGGYDKVTKEYTPAGQLTKTTTESQPGKTVWDWLGLLAALAIPVVVGLGAAWFTAQQSKVSARENTDNQRETALQVYIDKMSELLLKEHMVELKPEYEQVRKIARVRTLTLLQRLNGERKGSLLQFLYESGFLAKDETVIDLIGADLQNAVLSGYSLHRIDLSGANLQGVDLSKADLKRANLSGADLSEANLTRVNVRDDDISLFDVFGSFSISFELLDMRGANLHGANLSRANLLGADLSGADLSGADLNNMNAKYDISLFGRVLVYRSFSIFSGEPGSINMRGANLSGANLYGANLNRAILSEANLSGANLNRANLNRAKVTEEQLKKAMSLKGATMPDGSKHP